MNDMVSSTKDDRWPELSGVKITAVTRLKHADLWSLVKRFGSQAALARHLGIRQEELGQWINLKRVPPAEAVPGSKRWTEDYLRDLEAKLIGLTGKSWDEIFPQELRDNAEFMDCSKTIEQTAIVQAEALAHYAIATTERLTFSQTNHGREALRSSVAEVMKTLSDKEQEVVKLRFGLGDDGRCYTLEEVGHMLKASRERIRQIEAKAIRKLGQPCRADVLIEYAPRPIPEFKESQEVWPSELYANK